MTDIITSSTLYNLKENGEKCAFKAKHFSNPGTMFMLVISVRVKVKDVTFIYPLPLPYPAKAYFGVSGTRLDVLVWYKYLVLCE
jgi:hypothetical protein